MAYISATRITLDPVIDPAHPPTVIDAFDDEPVRVDPYLEDRPALSPPVVAFSHA